MTYAQSMTTESIPSDAAKNSLSSGYLQSTQLSK